MKIYIALLVPLFFASCNQPPKQEIVVDEELKILINQKNKMLEELYASGNIDSAVQFFASNMIQMPPNAPAIRGKEAFVNEWNKAVSVGKWIFDLEAQEVRRSGPMAVELGTYTLKFEPGEHAPIPEHTDTGHYVVLWEKQDDDWKIVWDAPVSEVPIPVPPMEE